jgi:hypothetical protein
MSDIRPKEIRPMTDGTYVVAVQLEFVCDGDTVRVGDHAQAPVGDACAALHQAALAALGGEVLEARNTDAFERKPPDPGKVTQHDTECHAHKR